MARQTVTIPYIGSPERIGSKISDRYEVIRVFGLNKWTCFGNMLNSLIAGSEDPIFVFSSEKIAATDADIDKMLGLLSDGYGLASLYRFGLFAMPKMTFNRVGRFEERFLPGIGEDGDYYRRLLANDIAIYMSDEAELAWQAPSSWSALHSAIPVRIRDDYMPWDRSIIRTNFYECQEEVADFIRLAEVG